MDRAGAGMVFIIMDQSMMNSFEHFHNKVQWWMSLKFKWTQKQSKFFRPKQILAKEFRQLHVHLLVNEEIASDRNQ